MGFQFPPLLYLCSFAGVQVVRFRCECEYQGQRVMCLLPPSALRCPPLPLPPPSPRLSNIVITFFVRQFRIMCANLYNLP